MFFFLEGNWEQGKNFQKQVFVKCNILPIYQLNDDFIRLVEYLFTLKNF